MARVSRSSECKVCGSLFETIQLLTDHHESHGPQLSMTWRKHLKQAETVKQNRKSASVKKRKSKKKEVIRSPVTTIETVDQALPILDSVDRIVVGFVDSLEGSDSKKLCSVAELEYDVNFYQTDCSDVAEVFSMDPGKRPALVMLKREVERLNHFGGKFTSATITKFVQDNKLPLVIKFARETAPLIYRSALKNQILLFVMKNNSEEYLPAFQDAAELFKGKLMFVYVDTDDEDVGKALSNYFGVNGDGPQVLAYSRSEDAKKFCLDGQVTSTNIKAFGDEFLADKLTHYSQFDPVTETNDSKVKIVVEENFNAMVLDDSKDVLLEIYAPWCARCQSFEAVYNQLAYHVRGVPSLVIAKMDGTIHQHTMAKLCGFPTLLFFPAGKKDIAPLHLEIDQLIPAFYELIKKNGFAVIPVFYKYIKDHASAPETRKHLSCA
ncbi:hypothetical protein MKW94_012487 [Papaver nudicaule]|uniref:protein disulfide-isomerase n=1 Tax=Papaver nudicaule TaxID=74823 RepID=A0AA41S970_PAPNU|nr:hypothetical protein [Papaver nudicaule]